MMTEQQYDRLERAATLLCEGLLYDRRESRKQLKQLKALLEAAKKSVAARSVVAKNDQDAQGSVDDS